MWFVVEWARILRVQTEELTTKKILSHDPSWVECHF